MYFEKIGNPNRDNLSIFSLVLVHHSKQRKKKAKP